MRAVVFGATGFLGRHVVEQLGSAGHSVTACVRATSDTARLGRENVAVARVDSHRPDSLERALEGAEVVFNCIADTRLHKPLETYRATDVAVARSVAEAAATAGVRRFVQLSTIEVYGYPPLEPPFDETTSVDPQFPYQKAMREREQALSDVAARTALALVLLRPASALGRGNRPLERLAVEHARGRFPVIGNGTEPFSAVDARDVGRAMVWLGEQPAVEGQTYLVKAFETSWLGIKQVMDELRHATTKVQRLPVPVAQGLARILEWITPYSREPVLTCFVVRLLTTPHLYADSKLRATGFVPRYDLRDAIAHLLNLQVHR